MTYFEKSCARMLATGFGIMMRAWWLFRQHQTAICPTAETTLLITDDIHAFTRNPMYLGMVLMLSESRYLRGRGLTTSRPLSTR